jgi:hypothetical protein
MNTMAGVPKQNIWPAVKGRHDRFKRAAQFEITGPDAEAFMQYALTRNIRRLAVGEIAYSASCLKPAAWWMTARFSAWVKTVSAGFAVMNIQEPG